MTDNQELVKNVVESYRGYRGSGTTLMATVITLSIAIFIGIHPVGPRQRWLAIILFLPIALALAQQLAHYIGQMYEARTHFTRLNLAYRKENIKASNPTPQDMYKAMPGTETMLKNEARNMEATTKWFIWADCLCIATVVCFFIVAVVYFFVTGFWAATHLPSPGHLPRTSASGKIDGIELKSFVGRGKK